MKEWARKKKSIHRRSDLEFTKFIREEFPDITDPERERRILDRLLYGKEKR